MPIYLTLREGPTAENSEIFLLTDDPAAIRAVARALGRKLGLDERVVKLAEASRQLEPPG